MLRDNIRQLNAIVFQKMFNNYSVATSIVVFIIASLALLGWQFDIPLLKRPIPQLVGMNPMSAVALLLSGVSLLLHIQTAENKTLIFTGKVLAAVVGLIGVLKIASIFTGFDAGVDRWLYEEKIASDLLEDIPNSMAPNTAVNLIFIGTTLLILKNKHQRIIVVSNFLVLITAFISLLSIIGYTYGAQFSSSFLSFKPMAIHTAICFLLLSIGILLAESDKGLVAAITGPYRGRQVIELLLPTAIVVPVFLGLLRIYGEKQGLYNAPLGTALFATANIVIFVFLILKSAASLNKSDRLLMQEMEARQKIEAVLKENNIFLDTILQNAPNMIFVKEAKELRFIQINKDGEAFLGMPKKEIIGKDDYEFLPSEQADRITKVDRQLLRDRQLVDIAEEKLTTKQGDRWLHTRKIPILDDNGEPQYLVAIAEDITEYKLQKDKLQQFYKDLEFKVQERTEALLKSEQRFKALLENSIDAISLVSPSGAILYQSPSVERMTGYSFADRNLKSVMDLLHPADEEMANQLLNDVLQQPGSSVPMLFRIRHKQGHYIWIEGTATNRLNDRSVETIVLNYRDITEKKLAEEALALSEEKYRLLFLNNPLPVWVFDTQSLRFLEVNAAAIAHYGYSREEFLQMTIKDIRPEGDIDNLMKDRVQSFNSSGTTYHGKWRHKKKSGEIIHVDINSRHIQYKGSIARFVLVNDITQKIEAEDKLNAMNEALSQRAKELAASNKDLEQFAYVASHDLQEPLRMVSSFLQLLEKKYKDQLDETAKQYIHFAVDGAERMKKLILDLLAYSRAGTSKEITVAVDMNQIVKDVIATFSFALKETEGEITVDDLPTIVAVKSQMQQLLQNLVSNALKYRGDRSPKIKISCTEEQLYWCFRVADNGIGIDERFYEKIFVIFQRLHNKTEYSGTGIGLAICKKIVERHGGTIQVESKPGVGTTFIFSVKK
jgi:two-component system CheB/CheR fusion protein